MKGIVSLILLSILVVGAIPAQESSKEGKIRLIVRGDDIGSSHAANVGCIKAYKEGILQSVELMVPCPWFEEAVKMLNENPGLDVGIHCTLTSEWENYKWGPLTHAPSITTEEGYFYQGIWPSDNFEGVLRNADYKLEEIEEELRAQIELALEKVPHITHMNCHMGCSSWDEEVSKMFNDLKKEYGLDIDMEKHDVQRMPVEGFREAETTRERIDLFVKTLRNLEPGTYLWVEHPGVDTPELRAIGHRGNYDVARNRNSVVEVLTSEKVKQAVEEMNIELIGYKDLTE
jgi:hypothetical protein